VQAFRLHGLTSFSGVSAQQTAINGLADSLGSIGDFQLAVDVAQMEFDCGLGNGPNHTDFPNRFPGLGPPQDFKLLVAQGLAHRTLSPSH
jgi:hypothetical protein